MKHRISLSPAYRLQGTHTLDFIPGNRITYFPEGSDCLKTLKADSSNLRRIVDEIIVSYDLSTVSLPRYCFIVFSSKEPHIQVTIDWIEQVLSENRRYEVKRFDESIASEDDVSEELNELLAGCAFAVVILDGLRPNVLFEYGVLKGLGKPCIVLIEDDAEVDVLNYYAKAPESSINNPKIDMSSHFSDIRGKWYVRYNKNQPKLSRDIIKKEFIKKSKDIEDEYVRMAFPDKERFEAELSTHVESFVEISGKDPSKASPAEIERFLAAIKAILDSRETRRTKLSASFFLQAGWSLIRLDKLDDALDLISKGIGHIPRDPRLYAAKAEILARLDLLDESLATADKGILIEEVEPLFHVKALVLVMLNKNEEAMQAFERGLELNDKCSALHFYYAIALYESQRYEEALTHIDTAMKTYHANDDALTWKARILLELDRIDDAQRSVRAAIEKNNKNPEAWYVMGLLDADDDIALKNFEECLKLDPSHWGAFCSKASHLSNLGRREEALLMFREAQKQCNNSKECIIVKKNIVTTLRHLKRYQEILPVIDEIDAAEPGVSDTLELKAIALLSIKRAEEAETCIKQAIEISPDDSGLWYNKACINAVQNKIDDSLESLTKAISLDIKYKEMARSDSDFDQIRQMPSFKEIVGITE